MANDVMFEGKERRIAKIEQCLAEYALPVSKRRSLFVRTKGSTHIKL